MGVPSSKTIFARAQVGKHAHAKEGTPTYTEKNLDNFFHESSSLERARVPYLNGSIVIVTSIVIIGV